MPAVKHFTLPFDQLDAEVDASEPFEDESLFELSFEEDVDADGVEAESPDSVCLSLPADLPFPPLPRA
jgi:hypothetical protein